MSWGLRRKDDRFLATSTDTKALDGGCGMFWPLWFTNSAAGQLLPIVLFGLGDTFYPTGMVPRYVAYREIHKSDLAMKSHHQCLAKLFESYCHFNPIIGGANQQTSEARLSQAEQQRHWTDEAFRRDEDWCTVGRLQNVTVFNYNLSERTWICCSVRCCV